MCKTKHVPDMSIEDCCSSQIKEDCQSSSSLYDCQNQMSVKQGVTDKGNDNGVKMSSGGWRYIVVIGAFVTYFIADGWAYSFGIIFTELLQHFHESHAKTSIIGALIYAVPLTVSPLICALCNLYSHRLIGIIGGIVCCSAFIISSFANSVEVLITSLGVLASIGMAMVYLSAYLTVTIYFNKKRGLALGLAVTGSGLGAFAFPPLLDLLMTSYSWRGALFIIGAIFLNIVAASALFRPLKNQRKSVDNSLCNGKKSLQYVSCKDNIGESQDINSGESSNTSSVQGNTVNNRSHNNPFTSIISELETVWHSMMDKEIYCNLCFSIFCASTFVTYLWIGTLYIYLVDKVMILGIDYTKAAFLLSLIGIGRTIGQIVLGYLGDVECINTVLLYATSIALCGFSVLMVPFCVQYASLTVVTLIFGFFVSSTYTLQILCLVKMFNLTKATNAFGFLQLVQGLATLLGTPLTGWMFDELEDYDPPFYVAGGMLIFSAGLLVPIFIRLHRFKPNHDDDSFSNQIIHSK